MQLEFFLYKARDTASVLWEALARAKDDMRIKQVVRIVDAGGEITARAMEAVAGKDAFEDYLQYECRESGRAWFLRRWRMARHRRMLGRKCARAKARLAETALDRLGHAALNGKDIAVEEDPCAPLRFARHDELHELLETARRAHDAWVFVFEPNHILADSNKLLCWI